MTDLAPYLSTFLREYLPCEREASLHTCETYAYAFQLLVTFAAHRLKLPPSKLTIEQLDVNLIVDFLNHLEKSRGNSARTCNARGAAIKAFFRFLEYRVISCLEQARQIKAIPVKRTDDRLINHLTPQEIQVLLDTPDPHTVSGIRDKAMLYLCFAAGLRVSELISLQCDQLEWQPHPCIHVTGKGRRERVLPLWKETTTVLKAWMAVRPQEDAVPEIFLNAQGLGMTRSGFEYILSKHVKSAIHKQPSLAKKNISPHVLRHSCALCTLKATHDIRKVSLWLGHADLRSTAIYLRADPSEKFEILMETVPPKIRPGKFNAPDKLLSMLKEKY